MLGRNKQFTTAAPVTKRLPLGSASHTGYAFLEGKWNLRVRVKRGNGMAEAKKRVKRGKEGKTRKKVRVRTNITNDKIATLFAKKQPGYRVLV